MCQNQFLFVVKIACFLNGVSSLAASWRRCPASRSGGEVEMGSLEVYRGLGLIGFLRIIRM